MNTYDLSWDRVEAVVSASCKVSGYHREKAGIHSPTPSQGESLTHFVDLPTSALQGIVQINMTITL